MRALPEPWRIKSVERIRLPEADEREALLEAAGYNPFRLPSDAVFIDLLTDSGGSAMSDRQWAALMTGDEAYAGSRSYFRLLEVIHDLTGLPHAVPVHQGRAAETLLFSLLVAPGTIVPGNGHFDTTRANIEAAGGEAVDLPTPLAADPQADHPFKGDVDLERLGRLLAEAPRGQVPLVVLTLTNNRGGGQPVSLANLRAASDLCRSHGVPLFIDACRFAENAWFVKQREVGQGDRPVGDIAREIFSLVDGCTMSAKKDGLVNIGGFLAARDPELMAAVERRMVVTEGFATYGGLAGRDLAAMAQGLTEVLDESYLAFRTAQVARFGARIAAAGVPVVQPVGGHAVYLDAGAFLPHLSPDQFPAWALTLALYRAGGVRSVEIGGVMLARTDPQTGETVWPELDLVRLAVPRRAYSNDHLDYVAEVLGELAERPEAIHGVEIVESAPVLRHFTARFRELAPVGVG